MPENFSFKSMLGNFYNSVVYPAIDQRMRAAGGAWVDEATRLCPVDTGQLRDSIGFYYDQRTRTLTLYADKYYTPFVEFGTRHQRAQPFMRPAMRVVGKPWGVTVEAQMPMIAPKYIPRTQAHSGGKLGGRKLHLGHKKSA